MQKGKIISKKEIAENTYEVEIKLEEQIQHKAGQYVELCLENPIHKDERGVCREFSIVSGPHEENMRLAFRASETAFKKSIIEGEVPINVTVDGPFGMFILPKKTERPIVCIAGGIGITPFVSMASFVSYEKTGHTLHIIHTNVNEEKESYKDELKKYEESSENITHKAHIGMFEESLLSDLPIDESIFFIAGPPRMVAEAVRVLTSKGVDDMSIRVEEFSGYA